LINSYLKRVNISDLF